MLVKFNDEWFKEGSVPYDEVGTIRQDHDGYAIVKCKSGDVIVTKTLYQDFIDAYQSVVLEDMEMIMGEDEDEDEEDV
jgi:hypothetical protein